MPRMQAFRHFQKKKALRSDKKASKRRDLMPLSTEQDSSNGGMISFLKTSQKRIIGMGRVPGREDSSGSQDVPLGTERGADLTSEEAYASQSQDIPRRGSRSMTSASGTSITESDTPISPRDGSPLHRLDGNSSEDRAEDWQRGAWGYAAIAGLRVVPPSPIQSHFDVNPGKLDSTKLYISESFWQDYHILRTLFPQTTRHSFRYLAELVARWSASFIYARGFDDSVKTRIQEHILEKFMVALTYPVTDRASRSPRLVRSAENIVMAMVHTKIFTASIRPQHQIEDQKLNQYVVTYHHANLNLEQFAGQSSGLRSDSTKGDVSSILQAPTAILTAICEKAGLQDALAFEQNVQRMLREGHLHGQPSVQEVSRTPMDKLQTIERAIRAISDNASRPEFGGVRLDTESLISLLAAAIIKANMSDLESILFYLSTYRFHLETQVEAFTIVCFRAALAYIQSDPCNLVPLGPARKYSDRNRSISIGTEASIPECEADERISPVSTKTSQRHAPGACKSSECSLPTNSRPMERSQTLDETARAVKGSPEKQEPGTDSADNGTRRRSKSVSWFMSDRPLGPPGRQSDSQTIILKPENGLMSTMMARAESLPGPRRMSASTVQAGRMRRDRSPGQFFPRTRSLDPENALDQADHTDRLEQQFQGPRRPWHGRARSEIGQQKPNSVGASSGTLLREASEGSLTSFAALPTGNSLWDFVSMRSWPWEQQAPPDDGVSETQIMSPPTLPKSRANTKSAHEYMASLSPSGTSPSSNSERAHSRNEATRSTLRTITLPGTGRMELPGSSSRTTSSQTADPYRDFLQIPAAGRQMTPMTFGSHGIATKTTTALPPMVDTLTAMSSTHPALVEFKG